MQADAAGYHGAQSQEGGQVEDIRSDDDPGAQPLLMTGHRGNGSCNLGRICRQRRHDSEQRLRQAQPLSDPLKPGDQNPANRQTDQRPGQEEGNRDHDRHPAQP